MGPGRCWGQRRVPLPAPVCTSVCLSAPLAARAGLGACLRWALPSSGPRWGLSAVTPGVHLPQQRLPPGCCRPPPNCESLSFCRGPCSAEGREECQAPAEPSASLRLFGLPAGCHLRWPAPRHLLPGSPQLPSSVLGRGAYCCTAEIVKLNFPDVQAPGARACCLERKWGLGKAVPYFLPAHPAFPVPPSTAGAVNHSWPASPAGALTPSPHISCQPLPSCPMAHVSGSPTGPGVLVCGLGGGRTAGAQDGLGQCWAAGAENPGSFLSCLAASYFLNSAVFTPPFILLKREACSGLVQLPSLPALGGPLWPSLALNPHAAPCRGLHTPLGAECPRDALERSPRRRPQPPGRPVLQVCLPVPCWGALPVWPCLLCLAGVG